MSGPFSQAFLAGEPRAAPFLARAFADPVARLAQVNRAAKRRVSPQVMKALVTQNQQYVPSSARDEALEALSTPGTTVMVTGQQVGLFLGPLYSFHKAAAAIADAKAIERESGIRCVPVFWLQSEDHDFAEINECVVVDKAGQLVTLKLDDGPAADSRVSVKHVVLGPSVARQVERLAEAVGPSPFLEAIARNYKAGAGLVQAFAGLMAEVFANEGLIMLDPRDASMATAFAPVHERAIRDASHIADAMTRRSAALEEAGFDVQVHIRANAPLSFFHPEGPTGARQRVDGAAEPSPTTSPLSWSSSALLRPILQDSVLPTVGYVGGPGEANYFAQLRPLYDAFELEMPMFVPRARFRLIDARTKARMVEAPELKKPASLEAEIVRVTSQLLDTVDEPALEAAQRRTRGTIARAASRFALRYARLLNERDEVSQRVARVLSPRGEPQERVLGLPAFACTTGIEAVKAAVFAALVPFDPELKDVFL